ncbi:ABC transporter ATP-binding protein [Hamadaea sp. NPDC051192]|uniref:ABC transporter ATP-binding protein n=1 Tax=Hamadaea sp. NPDC051192 TaxID=3154940 RepID=UPI0034194BF6
MIVQTAGLTKRYGTHAALDGVDLSVPPGSVYGLVGPNGAGKTTLLGILAGLRRPTSGEIGVSAARSRVAMLPDTPQFDPWLTGREVVLLAAHLAAGPGGRPVTAERADAVLADSGLADAADRRVGGYSRGMLQRLGFAATIVGDPELLLLDEPASALDPIGRREVLDLIARLRGRATVVFSSHILADVQEVCDRIGIMRDGRLLFQGTVEDLLVGRATPAYRVRLRGGAPEVEARLRDQPWVTDVRPETGGLLVGVRTVTDAETHLAGVLAAAGAQVISLGPREADLEDVFLELMS